MKAHFIDSETGVIGLGFGSIWPVICLCRPLPSELVDEPKFIRVHIHMYTNKGITENIKLHM